jgi:Fe2+ transport protein
VPDLDIALTLLDSDRELFTTAVPFLWHPYLYHYGTNARVPGEGPYAVRVRIDPPTFMRHDPVNGKRYAEPVDVVFEGLRFTPGRKPSPDAQPRGADTHYAG